MKKNILIYAVLSAVLVFSMTTCEKFCTDGNGHMDTEYRVVSEFYGVKNSTEFDVNITYDSVYSVRVNADDNLMQEINTSVKGDNLIIETDNDNCIQSSSNILIDIHMPLLDNIELTGSGNMDIFDFKSTRLEVTNTGSGDIDIRNLIASTIDFSVSGSGSITVYGKAEKANYLLSGSGEIYANDIKVGDCDITSSGSGDIYCYVIDHLNVILSGSGDVIYSGSPELTTTDSGSGDIFKRE
jgi:hypothetical protein